MQRQVRWLSVAAAIAALVTGCKQPEAPAAAPGKAPAQEKGTGAEFEVKASIPGPVQAGAQVELVAQVVAKQGFHINAEYPVNFQPGKSSPGIQFELPRYDLQGADKVPCAQGSADACELRAKIPFVATKAAEEQVSGVLAFSVCNPERCLIEKVPVEVKVTAR